MNSIKKDEHYQLSEKEMKYLTELDESLKNNCMERKILRVGVVSSILSMTKNGLPIGVMICHFKQGEKEIDIQISSDKGKLISYEEEKYFTEIINSSNIKESINLLFSKLKPSQGKSIIVIGTNDESKSKNLCDILFKGLKSIERCSFNLYNNISTPGLFFLTFVNQMAFEKLGLKHKMIFVPQDNYWTYLSISFHKFHNFYKNIFKNAIFSKTNYENNIDIKFDAGDEKIQKEQILNILNNKDNNFDIKFQTNNSKSVQINDNGEKIVYYIDNYTIEVSMEKMIVLFCKMLNFLIENFSKNLRIKYYQDIKMGIITTIYSNTAFDIYMKNNFDKYQIKRVKPGFRNLQEEAKNYDISICYEKDGMGTIFINDELSKKFGKLSSLIETSKDSQIIELFQLYVSMFNITYTDAIANFLIIESILKIMNLSLKDVNEFYNDMPYKVLNLEIKNLNKIRIDDEYQLVEPLSIKNVIDKFKSENNICKFCFIHDDKLLNLYLDSENDKNNQILVEELMTQFKKEGII